MTKKRFPFFQKQFRYQILLFSLGGNFRSWTMMRMWRLKGYSEATELFVKTLRLLGLSRKRKRSIWLLTNAFSILAQQVISSFARIKYQTNGNTCMKHTPSSCSNPTLILVINSTPSRFLSLLKKNLLNLSDSILKQWGCNCMRQKQTTEEAKN